MCKIDQCDLRASLDSHVFASRVYVIVSHLSVAGGCVAPSSVLARLSANEAPSVFPRTPSKGCSVESTLPGKSGIRACDYTSTLIHTSCADNSHTQQSDHVPVSRRRRTVVFEHCDRQHREARLRH